MPSEPPADVAAALDVSRETLARLGTYVDLLLDWNQRINLISRRTAGADEVWRRHVLDSAQIVSVLPAKRGRFVDVGSGAGLPGIVLAIMGVVPVELIESSAKKCAFLRVVSEALALDVAITHGRVEDMPRRRADVIVARAVAPIARFLDLIRPILSRRTRVILFKGIHVESELTDAHKIWKMRVTRTASVSDPSGVILTLEDVHHGLETLRPGPRAAGAGHRQPKGRRR